tara:strand:- start:1390 stop:1617 length:228 start_codon:yes stop_codon:yes gene_type:complete
MTKIVYNGLTGEITEVELTAEEETQKQADIVKTQEEEIAHKQALENSANLKASAKAKLIAGEKLTEEEANILVGV